MESIEQFELESVAFYDHLKRDCETAHNEHLQFIRTTRDVLVLANAERTQMNKLLIQLAKKGLSNSQAKVAQPSSAQEPLASPEAVMEDDPSVEEEAAPAPAPPAPNDKASGEPRPYRAIHYPHACGDSCICSTCTGYPLAVVCCWSSICHIHSDRPSTGGQPLPTCMW